MSLRPPRMPRTISRKSLACGAFSSTSDAELPSAVARVAERYGTEVESARTSVITTAIMPRAKAMSVAAIPQDHRSSRSDEAQGCKLHLRSPHAIRLDGLPPAGTPEPARTPEGPRAPDGTTDNHRRGSSVGIGPAAVGIGTVIVVPAGVPCIRIIWCPGRSRESTCSKAKAESNSRAPTAAPAMSSPSAAPAMSPATRACPASVSPTAAEPVPPSSCFGRRRSHGQACKHSKHKRQLLHDRSFLITDQVKTSRKNESC
jgi:hypothetical protein